MSQIAVLLMADTDTREATGRMANALTVVKEGEEEGDSVRLVLDGAGTKWAPELAREDHKYHRLSRTCATRLEHTSRNPSPTWPRPEPPESRWEAASTTG